MSILSFLARLFPCFDTPPAVDPEREARLSELADTEVREFLQRHPEQAPSETPSPSDSIRFSLVESEPEETPEAKTNYSFRKKRPEEDWYGVSSELSADLQAKAGPVGMAGTRHRAPGNPLGASFASELRRLVGERFAGRASWVYRAAHVSRQAYSAIISDDNHRVARGTALALAFALHLSEGETEQLLRKAGFSLSDSLLADVIYRCCIRHGVGSLDTLNRLLGKYRCAPLP